MSRVIDNVQHFIFEHANIRGELVHIDATYETIINQRHYPLMVKHLLGEALVSCLLLTSSIKFEGDITLQFLGDTRLPLLIVQCDHKLQIRGFAQYQNDDENIDYNAAFLQGQMAITINQHNQTQSYQSVVPICSLSMADNLMHYFDKSEQIKSRVCLAINNHTAAGIMLQLMPDQNKQHYDDLWEYATHIFQTIKSDELLTLSNQNILHRLYHETALRVYPKRAVQFQCRCTTNKMKQALDVLGETDVRILLKEKGMVRVICDFCSQNYDFLEEQIN